MKVWVEECPLQFEHAQEPLECATHQPNLQLVLRGAEGEALTGLRGALFDFFFHGCFILLDILLVLFLFSDHTELDYKETLE
jgi:hypothetical protein